MKREKRLINASDFVWENKDQLPLEWTEGAFHGNGRLGSVVYFEKEADQNYIHVELGCNEVYDRRMDESPRLPIGYLRYACAGSIVDFQMRTDLYKAMTELCVVTEEETIKCSFYVCAKSQLIVVEQQEGSIAKWKFVPRKAMSPRQMYGIKHHEEFRINRNYIENPCPELTENGDEFTCVQPLDNHYATITFGKRCEDRILLTIRQEEHLTKEMVKEELDSEIQKDYKQEHLAWWEEYYSISGIEVPDCPVEKFYWRQVYKLGSAVREDSIVLDNQGPWLFMTPWPGTWWNLNVQLSYWPLYTSNRLSQAKSLNKHLLRYYQDLIENVPEEYQYDSAGIGTSSTWNLKSKVKDPLQPESKQFVELGNLTWVLHNCWLYYQMTMEKTVLEELVYPLLTRAVNYYLHFVKKEDGKWHLPATDSPEYNEKCEDCNYDLAMLKWGCSTLLECTRILGVQSEKEELWKDICENLVDFPKDETGYMIGKNLPYRKSHRHFSHLMMHIPLYLVNRENSDTWELVKHSIDHWFSYKGDILGFSYVGASLLCSAYNQGDPALQHIRSLLETCITWNTMYVEGGPVIETPLAGMECIQQLLLQSWGGKVRVFPAVPSEWENASFWKLAAQGGFTVSASYENGKTEWIEIRSKTDTECTIETDIEKAEISLDGKNYEHVELDKNYTVALKKGETVYIRRSRG